MSSVAITPEPTTAPQKPVGCVYPLRIQLNYQVLREGTIVGSGSGWSVYFGSKSVQFEPDGPIPLNVVVQLSVPWPVRLENRIDLALRLIGRTTGVSGKRVTVEVLKYEFRLRGAGRGRLIV